MYKDSNSNKQALWSTVIGSFRIEIYVETSEYCWSVNVLYNVGFC
jgi:hypothetical protein